MIGRALFTFWSTDGTASYWNPGPGFPPCAGTASVTAIRGAPSERDLGHLCARGSVIEPGMALFELRSLTPAWRARITSVSNSWATACSAWPSRTLCSTLSDGAGGLSVPPLNVLVAARDLCARTAATSACPAPVRLGKQARDDGASQSDNVLGDVVEALIGALFLDGGFEAARDFILNLGAGPGEPGRTPQASQVRACRNWPRRNKRKPPELRSRARTGRRTMRRNSPSRSRSQSSAMPTADGQQAGR